MVIRHWKILLGSGVVVVLSVIALILIRYGQSSVSGTIDNGMPSTPSTQSKEPKTLTSPYFTLKYPATYVVQAPGSAASGLLEYHLLISTSSAAGTQVGITIANLPDGGVKETTNYKLYSMKPDEYSITEMQKGEDIVYIANRANGTIEQTALWAHDGKFLAMTMTASGNETLIASEFNMLLADYTWL